MNEASANSARSLNEYLAVLRRRRWIVIALPVVAAISAYAVSQTEPAQYQAGAQLLVNRSDVVTIITNIQDPSIYDPTRFLATVASIANSPELDRRVAAAAGIPGLSAD